MKRWIRAPARPRAPRSKSVALARGSATCGGGEHPRAWSMIRALISAAGLLLSGCGFHLEGRLPLPQPIRRPYIEAPDQQSDFVQSLRRQMLISGAHPVDSRDQATAVVDILDDAVKSSVLSVTAQNRPAEYQVTYTVRFAVVAGGRELLPPQQVSSVRSYSFDESLLLAKDHEEAILQQAMGQDLADIVMRRLSRIPGD